MLVDVKNLPKLSTFLGATLISGTAVADCPSLFDLLNEKPSGPEYHEIREQNGVGFFSSLFRESDYALFVRSVALKEGADNQPYYEVGISNMHYADKLMGSLQGRLERNRELVEKRGTRNHFYTWDDHPVRLVYVPLDGPIDPLRVSFSLAYARSNHTSFSPYKEGIAALLEDDLTVGDVLKIVMNDKSRRADVYVPTGLDTAEILKKTEGFPLHLDFIEIDPANDKLINPWKRHLAKPILDLFNNPQTRNQLFAFAVELRRRAHLTPDVAASADAAFLKANIAYDRSLKKNGQVDFARLAQRQETLTRLYKSLEVIPMRTQLSADDRRLNLDMDEGDVSFLGKYSIDRQVVLLTPLQLLHVLQLDWLSAKLTAVYEVEIPTFD